MKNALALAACTALLACPLAPCAGPCAAQAEVYFSPNGGALQAILDTLEASRSEVLVQAYLFTDRTIAKALARAHKRGVHVEVLLDTKNETGKTEAGVLLAAGVPVWTDRSHHTAHNKLMVVDAATVVTGSYNYNPRAETLNAENLLVLQSRCLASEYRRNWLAHRAHSLPFQKGQQR